MRDEPSSPKTGTARKQLNTLQAGRAFACLAVVLFHANDMLSLPKYLGHDVATVARAGSSGVQFFFVLSGFVILLAHQNDLGRPAKLRDFAWKRFRRLYPPLWILLLVLTPVFFIVPSFGKGGERNPVHILLAFLIAPAPYERLVTPEWTLRHEVVFYLVFALMIANKRIGFALLTCWLVLSAVLPLRYVSFPVNSLFAVNHLLFAMGMLACFAFRKFDLRRGQAWLLTGAGSLVFLLAWAVRSSRPDWFLRSIDLCFGLGATLLILGLAVLERREHIVVPASLVFLGEASYSIYLVHDPSISLCTKLLLHAHFLLPDWGIMLTVALAGVLVGTLFHLWLERPLLRHIPNTLRRPVPFPSPLRNTAAVEGSAYSFPKE